MYKYIITGIDGAQYFGLISLVIFTVFFIGLLIWVFTANKSYIQHMSDLPLEDENEIKTLKADSHV
jgi:cytochrome c oxidase cbb3-type subunit IV